MVDVGTALRIIESTTEKEVAKAEGLNVQLTFRSNQFEDINHKKVKEWIKAHDIKPLSIHYPTFAVNGDFADHLKQFVDVYGIRLFTVHPSWDSEAKARSSLELMADELVSLGAEISLEHGCRGESWSYHPLSVYNLKFPFTSLTFDLAHLDSSLDPIQEFDSVSGNVPVVHLSNVDDLDERRHLPIREGTRDIKKFIKHLGEIGYNGRIFLEYDIATPVNILRDDINYIESAICSV